MEEILTKIRGKKLQAQERAEFSIKIAGLLLQKARELQTSREKKREAQIAKMIQDPKGKAFLTSLTDGCFRSNNPRRVVNYFRHLLAQYGTPSFLNFFEKCGFYLLKIIGVFFPSLSVAILKHLLRSNMAEVIKPAEPHQLKPYLQKRLQAGIVVNLNRLGEAILGDAEATRRLNLCLEDLQNPFLNVISVKISSIFSQINLVANEWTLAEIKERLRILFRKAQGKLINLDMEEYRDLYLTATCFQEVLDEPEFLKITAGIALQSYLPDSFAIQVQLTNWAKERKKKGGFPIRIRIVKGANLGMEQVEASIKNFTLATFPDKKEVDANFKKMCLFGMQKENAEVVHLGIASHNLFEIGFALVVASENGVEDFVVYEMLEGMAPHVTRALHAYGKKILLYTPVAEAQDFHTAIAYLIRRLDENTGEENFLSHMFQMEVGSQIWQKQAELFRKSLQAMDSLDERPKRTQNRLDSQKLNKPLLQFRNVADTDFSLPQNTLWAKSFITDFQNKTFEIPFIVNGKEIFTKEKGIGTDPSRPNFQLHTYSLAQIPDVEQAISYCHKEVKWDRCACFREVANLLREKRKDFIGYMLAETGKPIQEGDSEVSEAIDMAEYYSFVLEQDTKRFGLKEESQKIGLVASPWNFSLSIPLSGILALLANGCHVIFKPAEEAALVGFKLAQICLQAGIPKEFLHFITCKDEPTGSFLIQHPQIEKVLLTGATSTARKFLTMRPELQLFAETGGKNAIIVSALADHDLAVKDIVQSAFGYAGQKCSACSLLILEEELYHDETFLKQLQDATTSLQVGSAWNLQTKVNPLIRKASPHLFRAMTTGDAGEKWLVEPKQNPANDFCWSPGIKLGVQEKSFMHQTELFGPILGVMCAKNLDHAIHLANGTPYGLTSGLHSLDCREQMVWKNTIVAGNLYINRGITGAIVARQPFGGTKASSFGRGMKAGGENYILQLFEKADRSVNPDESTETPPFDIAKLSFLEQEYVVKGWNSYLYWWKNYFSQTHKLSHLVGQDNILEFRPHKQLFLFLQPTDELYDLFLFFSLAKLTQTKIIVFDPAGKTSPFDFPGEKVHAVEEFTKKISQTENARIRAFQKVPKALLDSWAESMALFDLGKPKVHGRLELLRFVREVSLSYDYHRYGSIAPFFEKV